MQRKNNKKNLVVESLEGRLLMAVHAVLNNNDSGAGSLRQAISVADAGDTIDLSQRSGTIDLASTLVITKSLTLVGPSEYDLYLDGNGTGSVLTIGNAGVSTDVAISNVGITDGLAPTGGGINHRGGHVTLNKVTVTTNRASTYGGGIYTNAGSMTLNDSKVINNVALPNSSGYGAGIMVHGTSKLTISGSLIASNVVEASYSVGAGLFISSDLSGSEPGTKNSIVNSTIAYNASSDATLGSYGGGIYNIGNTPLELLHVTISGNAAASGGGGIYNDGSIEVYNSIVAGNGVNTSDYAGGPAAIAWGNLVGADDGGTGLSELKGNQFGSIENPLDPQLGMLDLNGGATHTIALLAGSPAINAGNTAHYSSIDQRGFTRDAQPDVGAYEHGGTVDNGGGTTNNKPAFTSSAPSGTHYADAKFVYEIATSDADAGAALTITGSMNMPSWLTLHDKGDGTATLSGTPTNADAGLVSLTLTVSDGTDSEEQVVSFVVHEVNHKPTFTSTPPSGTTPVLADAPFQYVVTTNDVDGNPLTISAQSLPQWLSLTDHGDGTATLYGTPSNADAGEVNVFLVVSDGSLGDVQLVSFNVNAVNHKPKFTSQAPTGIKADEALSFQVTATDADPNTQLTISTSSSSNLPAWITLTDHGNGTATLSGNPTNAQAGTHYFTLVASDGDLTAEQEVAFTVTAVNHAPTFTSSPVKVATSEQVYSYDIATTDSDNGTIGGSDDEQITITASPLPGWLTFTDNGDGTATLTGTPVNANAGLLDITLTVSDGKDSTQQVFTLDVKAIDHPSYFTSHAVKQATGGKAYVYEITAADEDTTNVSIKAAGELPGWLTLVDHGNGSATLFGTPTDADAGEVLIQLQIGDGPDAPMQKFELTVAAANKAPVLAAKPGMQAVAFNNFSQVVTATDADGGTLKFKVIAKPEWLTVTDNGDGTASLTGIATAIDNGANALVLSVSDGEKSVQQTYAIDVVVPRWTFDKGILGVYGSAEADYIQVWAKGNQIRVNRNGLVKNYNAADVKGIEIFGFDGNDMIIANTRSIPVYAQGNAHADTMLGGDEPDNFVGGGGKDYIETGGGNDRLDGFLGDDKLVGGPGDDRLYGGEGNDVLVGGAGKDEIHGEEGNDLIYSRDNAVDFITTGPGENSGERDELLDLLGSADALKSLVG